MYACSSDCCVGQAGRRGLVNLFWDFGMAGNMQAEQGPGTELCKYCLPFWSTGCITILETWRGRRGESRGMGMGMGMGQGPEPGPRPGTGDWGLGLGHGKQEKGGLEVGGVGGVRGGVAVGVGS